MAGKPSAASEKGKRYLDKNPNATAQAVAKHCGMSIGGVQKAIWWRIRPSRKEAK